MNDILAAAATALTELVEPLRLLMLFLGVMAGLVIGIVPGLGGLVGLTLLLPFTFHMDPYTALAVLIGMHAVVATSDSIPAVLFGVPGTVGSAATVMDGFPMSKRGEAGRALGAAFAASLLGGLFGAVLLAAVVPVMRPLMLMVGSPEMLSFCVFGLSLAAALSGRHTLRGLAAACLGLLFAMVGEDYQSGTMRWTFDSLYLWEGIPLVPVALGLFAVPEIAELVIHRTSIAGNTAPSGHGRLKGFKDVLSHPVILLRSATIGSVLGAMPGLGSAVIDWIAYGSAAKSKKKGEYGFGNGDVRGVIASESANNAKEGGALVPTLAFGVPGSAAMAILLGAFLVQGIVPGPDMLSKHLDITYTIILSLAAANLIGAGFCFLFAPQLARIALIPIGFLAPIVLAITFVGALQGGHAWGDLVVLFGAGALGYLMRVLSWPRPPLLLGLVLGSLIERYMETSIQIFGPGFLLRPVVFIVLVITVWGLLWPIIRGAARSLSGGFGKGVTLGLRRDRLDGDAVFAALVTALFAAAVIDVLDWPLGARRIPEIVAIVGLVFMVLYLATRLFVTPPAAAEAADSGGHMDLVMDRKDIGRFEFARRGVVYFAWIAGYFGLALLIGPLPALGLWIVGYMILGFGVVWYQALLSSVVVTGLGYLLFDWLLNTPWPQSLIKF